MSDRHGKESASDAASTRSVGRIVALFAALLVSLTLTAAASADVSFIKAYGWGVLDGASQFETCTSTCQSGSYGSGAGQLEDPGGVATDSSGDVYVADYGNSRIEEFSAAGLLINAYGTGGCPADGPGGCAGQLSYPTGVATDSSGDVYVADSNSSRIDEFSAAGSFIKAFGWGVIDGASQFEICTSTTTFTLPDGTVQDCQAGIYGSGAGQFSGPDGVATNSSGDVYVADSGNARVEEFSAAGSFIKAFGAGQLDVPEGVATDSSGDVYVADFGNNRIDEFSAAGTFIKAFGWGVSDGMNQFESCTSSCQAGIAGGGAGQLYDPGGVAIDSSGDVYVADEGNNRIDVFSAAGSFIEAFGWNVSGDGGNFETCTSTCVYGYGYGGGAGQFDSPQSVATDSSGDVYVADSLNQRIDEFSGSTLTQAPPTSATVTDGAGYSGQLTVTNAIGTVSYTETASADSSDVVVNSSGSITAAATLAPGVYTVGGSDSDTAGDAGSWSFTLTVMPGTLTQGSPTSASVYVGVGGYTGQLSVTNATGPVTYTESDSPDSLIVFVSSTGVVTADASTPGSYTVTGSDSDTSRDTGTWQFTLKVLPELVLSGTIQNRYGKGIPFVQIQIAGGSAPQTTETDDTGSYTAMVDPGMYTVTPQPINPQSDNTYEPQASSDCAVQGTACVVTVVDSGVEADFTMPQLPVVLVTGLSDSHPETSSPGQPCASVADGTGVGSMETLCIALQTQGFPVYVPSSSAGPGAWINNGAAVAGNAASLAQYLSTMVGGPALLVGHSMGGLFSRDAIARGTQAAGLFTIGTPFDGSFGADLDQAALHLDCSITSLGCRGLKRAAGAIAASLGSAAVADLTFVARAADNLTLRPPGVPMWTFAGIACDPTASPPGYTFPNDGIVGEDSAFGLPIGDMQGANLGNPTELAAEPDYHSSFLEGKFEALGVAGCGDHGAELNDSYVVEQVLKAADSLNSPFTGNETRLARLRRARFDGVLASSAAVKRRPVVLWLQTASMRSLKPGSKVPVAAGTSLLSQTPFAIDCVNRTVQALSAFGSRVFGFMPGMLACQHATLSASHAISIGIATDSDRVTATIVEGRKNGFTITVAAARAITRLVLKRGNRTLRVARHRLGRRAIQIGVTVAQASGLTLTAAVDHRRYSTTISALR